MKEAHIDPLTQRPARGSETKSTLARDTEGGPREPSQVHTGQRRRGWTLGTESSPHWPHDAEGGPWELSQVHTGQRRGGQTLGTESGPHWSNDTEGGPWEPSKGHTGPVTRRADLGNRVRSTLVQ
ncbi:unnamed protein product [Rangifer tarandus platyrhynchus]|uniref:Uncharacterized protein n=1 Tax=Rangifer tarandus platyrhynchus TaxID=3082113 RepID=A0AC59YCD2_RANTA